MSDKPKFIPVTDPVLADELSANHDNIDTPYTFKSNGQLWVEPEPFEVWRKARAQPE